MDTEFTRLSAETLYLALLMSTPALAVSLIVGLTVGVFQAVTQIQEQTLSFVPKLLAVGITLAVAGGWMGSEIVRFTSVLWNSIPTMIP